LPPRLLASCSSLPRDTLSRPHLASCAPQILTATSCLAPLPQCGRFHELAAFDGAQRSCREQLAYHAARRRKLRQERRRTYNGYSSEPASSEPEPSSDSGGERWRSRGCSSGAVDTPSEAAQAALGPASDCLDDQQRVPQQHACGGAVQQVAQQQQAAQHAGLSTQEMGAPMKACWPKLPWLDEAEQQHRWQQQAQSVAHPGGEPGPQQLPLPAQRSMLSVGAWAAPASSRRVCSEAAWRTS
jgi:hypothetical protein